MNVIVGLISLVMESFKHVDLMSILTSNIQNVLMKNKPFPSLGIVNSIEPMAIISSGPRLDAKARPIVYFHIC